MNLRSKVNLTLSGAFLVGLVLAGIGAYKVLIDDAVESSAREARIVMEQASAIRTYTAESIGPLLKQQMKVEFLPNSIPSFAAQSNFRLVQKKLPEYSYREPALNPTNVNDEADEWEADIINDFREHPQKTETLLTRETPVGTFLTLSRPLKVNSAACLTCHSTPNVAPPTMAALYGTEHGFGWKPGEIVGAQVVSIPMDMALQRGYHNLFVLMAALAVAFLVILFLVDALVRAFVVKPVIGISEMASEVSMGKLDAPEYICSSTDEIGSLASSFNRMRRSLQNAVKMLDEQPQP
jgi:HAMP domain-containing protein